MSNLDEILGKLDSLDTCLVTPLDDNKQIKEIQNITDDIRGLVNSELIKAERKLKICKKAINTFGERNQMIKAIEECGELITVLAQTFTKPNDVPVGAILTEIADVEIMIQQLRVIFGDNAVDQYKEEKLKKLEGVVW